VDALAKTCGMPISNASHHLLMLKDCGLAASRKEGLQVFYRLADPEVTAVVATVRRIAERQLAEVSRIVRENFETRDALQPVRREELLKMARRGPYCLLAFEAVDKLRKKGFRARRLEDGFPEWQAERLPVE